MSVTQDNNGSKGGGDSIPNIDTFSSTLLEEEDNAEGNVNEIDSLPYNGDSIGSGGNNNNHVSHTNSYNETSRVVATNDNDYNNTSNNKNEDESNESIDVSVGFASVDCNSNNDNDDIVVSSPTVGIESAKKKTRKKKKKKKNRPYISMSSSSEEEEVDDAEGSDNKVAVLPVLPVLPYNENFGDNSNTMIGNTNINNGSSSIGSSIIGNGNGNGNDSNNNINTCNSSNGHNNRNIIPDNIYDDNDDQNNHGIARSSDISVKTDNKSSSTRRVYVSSSNNNSNYITSTKSNNVNTSINSNVNSNVNTRVPNNNKSLRNFISATSTNTINTFNSNTTCSTELYQADTYSILALHGPIESPAYFLFGLMVYLFQITFLLLMVFSKVHPNWSNNGDVDNPDAGNGSIVQKLAEFIPANVSPLVQGTQLMATLTYIIFADSNVLDVVLGVELFPRLKYQTSDDKIGCMVFSSILRASQGILAIIVTLFLVVTTSNTIEIILNFTAINFISTLDNVGFEIIKWGKYGPKFEEEVKRIEKQPLPRCIFRKYKHIRYWCAVIPIAVILLACLCSITILQSNSGVWVSQIFRVQFQEKEQGLQLYNGCYEKNENAVNTKSGFRRKAYEGFKDNSESAKFGYCMDEHRWILFKGDSNVCDARDNDNELARSSKTYTFDVSTMFEEGWYSSSNTPLDVYFVEDTDETKLNETTCSSFLNDGNCDLFFNKFDFQYDGGDCCAPTCSGSDCGTGSLINAFGTDIISGDGFPNCKDPDMVPITIQFDSILSSREPQFIIQYNIPAGFNENSTIVDILADKDLALHQKDFFAAEPAKPLLFIDCDGRNVLNIYVQKSMEDKTETIMVNDGADCTITIRNVTDGYDAIWYVSYTIFHGDKGSVENNPIVLQQNSSNEVSDSNFRRIPDCFFDRLSDHIENSTVYTGIDYDPTAKAIDWLMNDESKQSMCGDSFFLERYALAVVSFATLSANSDNTTFINEKRQCVWPTINCENGAVVEMDLGKQYMCTCSIPYFNFIDFSCTFLIFQNFMFESGEKLSGGYIPSEIGLLTSLKKLNLSK